MKQASIASKLRRKWLSIIDTMLRPEFELDDEAAVEVVRTIAAMEQAGVDLDPGLMALVTVIARQLVDAGADGDSDLGVDDGQEESQCREIQPPAVEAA